MPRAQREDRQPDREVVRDTVVPVAVEELGMKWPETQVEYRSIETGRSYSQRLDGEVRVRLNDTLLVVEEIYEHRVSEVRSVFPQVDSVTTRVVSRDTEEVIRKIRKH